ncbi:MAG: DUF58 domain-containing protein [Cyanobacteria bacterium P01_G01_bin.54]
MIRRLTRLYRRVLQLPQTLATGVAFRGATPAYGGGLLLPLALAFFGAATNTMAGWLYVISGLIFALLVIGAVLPPRSLQALYVSRRPIHPITVGDRLQLELAIHNPSRQGRLPLQIQEDLPSGLTQIAPTQSQQSIVWKPVTWQSVAAIAPQQTHRCTLYAQAERRGIYHWPGVTLRTAAPLGLFWAYRRRRLPARAVVYPQVLPLSRCALIDTLAQEQQLQSQRDRRYQNATEGITRTLRPYRTGDPTRLIHWRTSARFDQLQVRELERVTTGREVTILLDNGSAWPDDETFEQAVTAAASLYFYASRCQFTVQLWTAATGRVQGNQVVLETLAAVQIQTTAPQPLPLDAPVLCLTAQASRLAQLPPLSRYLFFGRGRVANSAVQGVQINHEQPLRLQLVQAV